MMKTLRNDELPLFFREQNIAWFHAVVSSVAKKSTLSLIYCLCVLIMC